MLMIFLIFLALSFLLILINSFISKKMISDREKNSPFECGFDPKSTARIPFSLRFYLIAVIFLIFDVEITLIMPMPIMIFQNNLMSIMFLTLFFISILIVGLLHGWNEGALQWDL